MARAPTPTVTCLFVVRVLIFRQTTIYSFHVTNTETRKWNCTGKILRPLNVFICTNHLKLRLAFALGERQSLYKSNSPHVQRDAALA